MKIDKILKNIAQEKKSRGKKILNKNCLNKH